MAAILAITPSASWTLLGDGWKAEANGTVPKVSKNAFWLQASINEDTNEFVLTSTIQLVLSSELTQAWTGVRS